MYRLEPLHSNRGDTSLLGVNFASVDDCAQQYLESERVAHQGRSDLRVEGGDRMKALLGWPVVVNVAVQRDLCNVALP